MNDIKQCLCISIMKMSIINLKEGLGAVRDGIDEEVIIRNYLKE